MKSHDYHDHYEVDAGEVVDAVDGDDDNVEDDLGDH